jgi:hypothetical protein
MAIAYQELKFQHPTPLPPLNSLATSIEDLEHGANQFATETRSACRTVTHHALISGQDYNTKTAFDNGYLTLAFILA